MPACSTCLVVQLLRRLFVCRHGHSYVLRVSADAIWIECVGCLSVRLLDEFGGAKVG